MCERCFAKKPHGKQNTMYDFLNMMWLTDAVDEDKHDKNSRSIRLCRCVLCGKYYIVFYTSASKMDNFDVVEYKQKMKWLITFKTSKDKKLPQEFIDQVKLYFVNY